MFRRTVPFSAILSLALLGVSSCAQPVSDACSAITREQAIRIADDARRGFLSRSTRAVQANYAASAARIAAMNDGRGYGAQVSYTGKDGQTLTALIHEGCYVGWTM
jgi:hypothetical protein